MPKKNALAQLFRAARKDAFEFMHHLEAAAHPVGQDKIGKIVKAYKGRLGRLFAQIDEQYHTLRETHKNTLTTKNQQIRNLIKEKETVVSDNYLLEYKKKGPDAAGRPAGGSVRWN